MKKFTQKLAVFLILLFPFNLYSQYEITADMFIMFGNTDGNMSIGVNSLIFDQFEGGQLGAFYDINNDGEIGYYNNYYHGLIPECVGLDDINQGFFGLALWADESLTSEVDGLPPGAIPQFAVLHEDNIILVNDLIPGFPGYITNGILVITDATLSTAGCEDPNACNTSVSVYQDVEFFDDNNCIYPGQWFDCDGVCLDSNNNSICDIDENPGCTDPLYVNYDSNAGFDDGSCTETWEEVNSSLTSEIETLGSELSNVSYQLDTMTYAYITLLESPQCEEIIIDIEEGWNIFGYTSAQIVDIAEVMAPYQDKIYIIKDNNGAQYWPAVDFNGIGNFTPGGGYQIKAYEPFSISFEN